MKKFTDNINNKQHHYAGNEILKNELFDLIDENLIPTIDGISTDKLSLNGKEDLVIALLKIVENSKIDSKIDILLNLNDISESNENDDVYKTDRDVEFINPTTDRRQHWQTILLDGEEIGAVCEKETSILDPISVFFQKNIKEELIDKDKYEWYISEDKGRIFVIFYTLQELIDFSEKYNEK